MSNNTDMVENITQFGLLLDIIQLQKKKYDEKKLCRTIGVRMAIVTIIILTMNLFENFLPAFFGYIVTGIILVDVVALSF